MIDAQFCYNGGSDHEHSVELTEGQRLNYQSFPFLNLFFSFSALIGTQKATKKKTHHDQAP